MAMLRAQALRLQQELEKQRPAGGPAHSGGGAWDDGDRPGGRFGRLDQEDSDLQHVYDGEGLGVQQGLYNG